MSHARELNREFIPKEQNARAQDKIRRKEVIVDELQGNNTGPTVPSLAIWVSEIHHAS